MAIEQDDLMRHPNRVYEIHRQVPDPEFKTPGAYS